MSILLNVDCATRPTAGEILRIWIPLLHETHTAQSRLSTPVDGTVNRTVLYRLQAFDTNTTTIRPVIFPVDIQLRAMRYGDSHYLAVAESGAVYSWGDNRNSELGRDSIDGGAWTHQPSRVEALSRYTISEYVFNSFILVWFLKCPLEPLRHPELALVKCSLYSLHRMANC